MRVSKFILFYCFAILPSMSFLSFAHEGKEQFENLLQIVDQLENNVAKFGFPGKKFKSKKFNGTLHITGEPTPRRFQASVNYDVSYLLPEQSFEKLPYIEVEVTSIDDATRLLSLLGRELQKIISHNGILEFIPTTNQRTFCEKLLNNETIFRFPSNQESTHPEINGPADVGLLYSISRPHFFSQQIKLRIYGTSDLKDVLLYFRASHNLRLEP